MAVSRRQNLRSADFCITAIRSNMAKDRKAVLGAEIAKILSESIRDIKDPENTEMTSVLSVEVTQDLKYAKVVVSIFSLDEEKKAKTFDAIVRARGFLRSCLAHKMKVRTVPSLTIVMDRSTEYSAKISKILSTIEITPEKEEENEEN